MTAQDFIKLSKRDFDNGAIRDEIYRTLKEVDELKEKLANKSKELNHPPGSCSGF